MTQQTTSQHPKPGNQQISQPASGPHSPEHRGNILIVDDTPANLRLMTQMLAEQNFKVRPVPSGKLALNAIHAAAPDLILLDIKMPQMDGYEVSRQLKADPTTRDIPIIFISALDEVEDKVKAFTVGGVDYITKPFQFEEVQARIETHLTIRRLRRELQAYAGELEERVDQKVKELEQERAKVIHAGKMAAIGELATGVAHERNQPLTAITFEADYLHHLGEHHSQAETPPDSNVWAELREMGTNLTADVERCRRIIDHLRTFGRVSEKDIALIDLNDPIRNSFILTEERLKQHNVFIHRELAPDLPPIRANPHRLEQVFLNLISNAEHAMAEMAARVKTQSEGSSEQRAAYQKHLEITTEADGNQVIATVRDNGCGIPAEARANIFEPFFTTKPAGEGTGLGLSISYDIIANYGGEITFETEINQGTTFTLRFPIAEEGEN